MSRYLGPRVKKMRALGINLPGLSRKSIDRRPYPPGQHGLDRRRGKESAFKLRLQEKQKLRVNYGLTERQFTRLVERASKMPGNTGDLILQLLEGRLDNVVFRAGFARTIPAARQLVRHGHVLLNGRRADIPSARVRRGDVLALRPRSRELDVVATALADPVAPPPAWLAVDPVAKTIRVAAAPDGAAALVAVDTRLIVEFYAQ
ncbi:MAG: 30S ribosomal protein S4 [Deltaproteobacteria bacterium]|nr:30S ribosomal protein S4 [Deltaproteobacteria bacterium]MCW5808212.1 30S ribosomal protein S4 [Deltaproteobacteria bacterium]